VRIKAEKEFKKEELKAIIATSSLQLGIDIGSVDLVLQYMSPRTVSQIIQRVGRSGHESSRVSEGIIISTDEDDVFESSVIARKAMAGELERLNFHEAAYDVLAHQLVGLTLDQYRIDLKRAYEIISHSYPFARITFPEFLEVCKQLEQLHLIFLDDNITKKRRGFEYYFTQLSTIPDTKQYRVMNMIDQSFVGVVDEEFVALHGDIGTSFILKGEAYRIVQVEEDRVMVEPTVDIEAAVPGWEGELIPVPFEVAQEVGHLRSVIFQKLKEKDEREVLQDVMRAYPVDESSARKMIKVIKAQTKFGIIPDDKTILIEDSDEIVVIHAAFGTVVNESLGRFITSLLTNRVGSVALKIDPYRIILQFQKNAKSLEMIKEILFTVNPEHIRSYLEMNLTRSSLFEWKFVHVAKRFGAIERGAQYGRIRLGRIIDSFIGTPLYKETLKELEVEKFDIARAIEILRRIQEKKIAVIFKPGLSILGKYGLRHAFAEVVGPQKPEAEIFELFKRRIMQTTVRLACMNCGQWNQTYIAGDISKNARCGKCQAKLLAVAHPRNPMIVKIIKKGLKKAANMEEMRYFERARMTADLFLVYGKKAAIALAARGVGPVGARRILAKYHKDDDAFMRDLLDAERQFIKTRKFWSS
jgi:ATP-dependent Lhr-like helicase